MRTTPGRENGGSQERTRIFGVDAEGEKFVGDPGGPGKEINGEESDLFT